MQLFYVEAQVETRTGFPSLHMNMTRQPMWRNEEGGRTGVQREPSETPNRESCWLTDVTLKACQQIRTELTRQNEWVWERNVSDEKRRSISVRERPLCLCLGVQESLWVPEFQTFREGEDIFAGPHLQTSLKGSVRVTAGCRWGSCSLRLD